MARAYTKKFKATVNSTGATEAPLLLLEIAHADLAQPIRVVNDNQDLLRDGHTFTAMAFRATMPDDSEERLPRAALSIDNVGRELTQWLELSGGGQGATVRMIQVLRSVPDLIEWEVTLDINDVRIDMLEVSGSLGFDDILNLPAIPLTYRPDVAPGIF